MVQCLGDQGDQDVSFTTSPISQARHFVVVWTCMSFIGSIIYQPHWDSGTASPMAMFQHAFNIHLFLHLTFSYHENICIIMPVQFHILFMVIQINIPYTLNDSPFPCTASDPDPGRER